MKTTNPIHRKTSSLATTSVLAKTSTATELNSRHSISNRTRNSSSNNSSSSNNNNNNSNRHVSSHRSAHSHPRHTATRLSAASGVENSSSSSSSSSGSNNSFWKGVKRFLFWEQQLAPQGGTKAGAALPRVRSPIEPNLYRLPENLYRYYQPLPSLVRAMTVCLAVWRAFVTTNWGTWTSSKLASVSFLLVRQAAKFLVRSIAYALIAQTVLQDTLFVNKQPSRVTMNTLVNDYFLPSSLSKYEPITIDPISAKPDANQITSGTNNEPFTMGVHYLQYDNSDYTIEETGKDDVEDDSADSSSNDALVKKMTRNFDAIYFQHGFGASSLSWLPVLPTLAQKMNARVALGHDTVGFGFTDRPKDPRWYRPKQGARIAKAILARERDKSNLNEQHGPVCLVGHSMGSRSTLRLATQLPEETPKLIILSSPALGLIKPTNATTASTSTLPSKVSRLSSSLSTAFSQRIARPASCYVLRRFVGFHGFWKKGLEGVWGDPSKVAEDSEVLRYSWPSIGHGWEEGILKFASAQIHPADDGLDDDYSLFRRVLELPNTKVLIILGSRDKVIPTKSVKKFLEKVTELNNSKNEGNNNNVVQVVELEGLGHCAFEEDQETFCQAVEALVRDHWDMIR